MPSSEPKIVWAEVIDRLRNELLAGKTGGQIAKIFNVSRSAAIAAVHRYRDQLGVGLLRQVVEKPNRPPVQTKRNYARLVRQEINHASRPITTQPPPLDTFDKSQIGVPLAKLQHYQCKWPVSHNNAPQHLFCRCPRERGTPYCETHNYWSRRGGAPRTGPGKKG